MHFLQQPITTLPGVGAQSARRFEKLGIRCLNDLIFHVPLRYEDRTRVIPIGSVQPGTPALITGRVDYLDILPRGRRSLVCGLSDDSGEITLRFFHFNAGLRNALKVGCLVACYGDVRSGFSGLEMVHPDFKPIGEFDSTVTDAVLTPVYPLTEGLNQNTVRKLIKQALQRCRSDRTLLTELLPASILHELDLPSLPDAVETIHGPKSNLEQNSTNDSVSQALKRLAFDELLAHFLSLKMVKRQNQTWQSPQFSAASSDLDGFIGALPFSLTQAQRRVISEITADCEQSKPMLRLVQGDVGSGKTVVAAYAALLAVGSGYQVAVMAPTELLAEQHFRNFLFWFDNFELDTALLTGQLKGHNRESLLLRLAEGTINIVIGTHALFQEDVSFKNLGLCIIDEQHRFGVHQRLALRDKGKNQGIKPHQLVLTATPIPRTLAMLNYSDLDISVIDELPPNRKPVVTSVIPSERRDQVIDRIDSWVAKNRQAYWVCTLIEESDALQCEAAENTAHYLAEQLPDIRIALVHGRMKAADKEQTMQAFKNHQIDLLVATTVIEVGVDVPNAGLMIIENPERLGLSQLHQLRGRVGRGDGDSFCLLLYQSPLSDNARQRLGILRESNDGFLIAEKDLLLRGPGDVIGTRQTGAMQFKIADLTRDADLLDSVERIGNRLLTESPVAVEALCVRWLNTVSDYTEV